MDVKFRSLICCGLKFVTKLQKRNNNLIFFIRKEDINEDFFSSYSEQVLHLWLETLCSCTEIIEKYYYPWSFMRSPGWVQIKCELR